MYKTLHPLARRRRAERSAPTSQRSTQHRVLPNKLVLEGPGPEVQDDRPRALFRRHRPRRDRHSRSSSPATMPPPRSMPTASITTGQRGEAFVMARFATHTVGTQVIVIPKDLKYEWPKVEETNFIDELVDAKLHNLRMLPSAVVQRRDLPAPRATSTSSASCRLRDEVTKFVADKDPQKRAKKVDELLARKEFVDIWALKWSELLQIRTAEQQQRQLQGHALLLHLAARPAREERADQRNRRASSSAPPARTSRIRPPITTSSRATR